MALLGEFLINLAAGLAYDLLKAGAARLKAQALGEPAQRALRGCYETAFRAMLEEVATGLTPDDRRRLEDILRRFVARPEVAEGLLALALTGAPLPDLPALERAFARQFDWAGLEVGPGARFDRAMRALHRGLTTALLEEAGRPDSPLFNRVNLGRLLALQALLQDPGRALAGVNRRLARLEARGGQTVYNIVIARATGVAIGDGATVQGSLPPDVQDVLDAMLALLRELRSEAGGRSIAIGGGVSGSILITGDNNIVQGITHLPTDYGTRIRNFIVEYTGTPEEPVPFGGREAALAELDRWLADADAPPYLLLAAPAGRGKSALLVRWLERVRERDPDLPPVFVPVSLRFNTASQAVFFAALAARLAHLYGEKVPADLSHAPDFWRGMVSSFLGQPPPQGRLLVVLDGLDEATDWEAGPDLFPFQPPPGVRVVVSARYLADEEGPSGWLRRLGWDRPGLARPLDLDPLTREGVADVLERMGFPLAELGRRVDIVAELHRLSEGDPLLVRLYVGDLWQRGEAATRLQPEDLRGLKPGLKGYFDDWLKYQRKQWGERAPLKEQAVREVLNLLAAALAPLMQDDLLRLSPDLDTWMLEEALRPLARLVIGDGREQGYAFGHPRLGRYFWEKLGRQERRALEERFLTWGWETLEALKRREMAPADAPAYLVRALGGHLVRAKAGPEEWLRLVDGAWAAAGEALEGAYGLFLQDVHRAWQACAVADGERAERGERAPYLGGEVRCALVEASLHALAGNLPPELVEAAVAKGVWTPRQALAHVRQMPDPRQQARALAVLVPHLPAPLREQALREALAAAREIRDAAPRAEALRELAPHLPEPLREQALREALAAARGIRDAAPRAEALRELAPHLLEPLREQALREALAAAREIRWSDDRAEALAALAPHLAELGYLQEALAAAREIRWSDDRAEALAALAPRLAELGYPQEALAAARAIGHERSRVEALAALAPHLPAPLGEQALREALAAAREIRWSDDRARALRKLAPHLPEPLREQALREALAAAREIEWEWSRARALAALAPHLPAPLLEEALTAAREIGDADDRARALAALALRLAELGYPQEALAAAREIEQGWIRAEALAALAPRLAELGYHQEALAAAREVEEGWKRARALAALAPHLPAPLLEEALAAAREIRWSDDRSEALAALAPHLPEPLGEQALREALAAARAIGHERSRAEALAALAPHLPAPLGEQALREALTAARELPEWESLGILETMRPRAEALAALAPRLAELGYPQEALAAARAIGHERSRAEALAALAPRLAELGYPQEALAAARAIEREWSRAEALAALAPHLPAPLLEEALTAAREIGDADDRARALAALALRLAELGYHQEALAAAREVEEGWERAKALAALAPRLAELGYPQEALAAAREIGGAFWRARALAALAPHLPAPLLEEALAAAREIRWSDDRSEALAALAPHLPEPLGEQALREALAAAREIRNAAPRAGALRELAPHLPEPLGEQALREALAAAREIEKGWGRAKVLAALAPHLPEPLREQALREALAAAREIGDAYSQAEALAALAPRLPKPLREQALREALAAAREIEKGWGRAKVLAALAPHLPEPLLEEALAAAREIRGAAPRAEALRELAPHLPAPLGEQALREALTAARAIGDADDRAKALAALAPHLPVPLLEEALAAAREIKDAALRAKTLREWASHLPEPLGEQVLREALTAAREIGDADDRAKALAALAPRLAAWAEEDRATVHALWRETLPSLARRTRRHLLADLRALEPLIAALGGTEAVAETSRAIRDVGRWWP